MALQTQFTAITIFDTVPPLRPTALRLEQVSDPKQGGFIRLVLHIPKKQIFN